MDSLQYILSLSLILVVTLVIVGGIPEKPKIRVLAIVSPAFVFMTGLALLALDVLRLAGIKAPFRLSSIPRGGKMIPAIYLVVEDVLAVDGGGGTAFRERLSRRYEESVYFRELLQFLSSFWSIGAIIVGSATAAVVFVTRDRSVAYVVCFPMASASHGSLGLTSIDWMGCTFCVGITLDWYQFYDCQERVGD